MKKEYDYDVLKISYCKKHKLHWITDCPECIHEDYQSQIEQLKAELNARYAKDKEEVWYWLGDGNDHLESLVCPVLIEAADLRELLGMGV